VLHAVCLALEGSAGRPLDSNDTLGFERRLSSASCRTPV
jgi:hypothetical protein